MFRSERSGKTGFKVFRILSLFSFVTLTLLMFSRVVYGGLAPDFTLTDIDGSTFSLSDFRGKVVMIEFFSTWCGSCLDEIPHLKAVQEEFGSRLVIISISWVDTNEELREFRDDYDISWIVARDTANVYQKYDVKLKPTLYIIDQEGYTRYAHVDVVVGASTLIEEVYEIVPALLGDLNDDGIVDIYDVVTASIAFGSKQGDHNWNPEADIAEPFGKIDIYDVVTVATSFGKTV